MAEAVARRIREEHQRRRRAPSVDGPRVARDVAGHDARQVAEVGGEEHRLGGGGDRRAGQPPELGRQGRAEEGGVGQTAAELLGHERHLDTGRQGCVAVLGTSELAPARAADGGVELLDALVVVQLADGLRAEPVHHLRRRVAQGALLRREPDVHQLALGLVAS